jgi:putative ABC transport system substrate-binding protein
MIADLAIRQRLPAIHPSWDFVQAGLLMSYGAGPDSLGRLAGYVDRILKGARPADLPIEQPTEYKLAVNLKTAKALGLTIPPSLLGQADHVIE